jgi:hypothetical protein
VAVGGAVRGVVVEVEVEERVGQEVLGLCQVQHRSKHVRLMIEECA